MFVLSHDDKVFLLFRAKIHQVTYKRRRFTMHITPEQVGLNQSHHTMQYIYFHTFHLISYNCGLVMPSGYLLHVYTREQYVL